MTSHRFPRSARVRARCDFDRVFKAGRRAGLPVLALHWHRTGTEAGPRLGLAVSRKVDPHAVGRNRIKRRLREAFRRLRGELAAGDYVVVARPGASALDAAALIAAFHDLLRRAGALSRTAAADGAQRDPRRPDPAPGATCAPVRAGSAALPPAARSPAEPASAALPVAAPAGTLAPASPPPPADAPPAPPAEPACP